MEKGGMMKHLKFKFFIVVIFLFVAVAGFYDNSLDVFAAETVDNLHSQTKIYNTYRTYWFDTKVSDLFYLHK